MRSHFWKGTTFSILRKSLCQKSGNALGLDMRKISTNPTIKGSVVLKSFIVLNRLNSINYEVRTFSKTPCMDLCHLQNYMCMTSQRFCVFKFTQNAHKKTSLMLSICDCISESDSICWHMIKSLL